ncbi:MAG: TetR/AcrR family transcriptional regulator [Burkholderiales bacterium]
MTSRTPDRGPAAKRRARAPAPAQRDDAARLGRDDWLDAAHGAVVAGGFDAVRVLSLADALGITRGSFYWHFADHAELVSALIARWRARELEADRALEARASDDPVEDLLRLLDAALARGGRNLEAMRFELALRELGRQDRAVAAMLAEVDGVRMAVLTAKFERLVGDAAEARDLAALLYVAVAGAHQALARPAAGPGLAAYLRETIAEHLIRRRAPAPARRGRRAGVS